MPTLEGPLFFPVTPFSPAGAVDLDMFGQHLAEGLRHGPGSVFVACGTGEFHALEPGEYAQVVRCAADVTRGAVPLYAGVGGALPIARMFARAAADAGADGLLLMPPYLVSAPPAGVAAYAVQVSAETGLPMIVYNRDNATYDPASAAGLARLPAVTGFKDGRGDLDLLGQIVAAVRQALAAEPEAKPFQFFNGTPTAEISVPAYRAVGVQAYSSAVFCFVPEISLAFYHAVTEGDTAGVERLLAGFFYPLTQLRNKVPGYAVSLIKAGVRLGGLDVGGVRAPLVDPTPEHLGQLTEIIAAGRALVSRETARPEPQPR